DYYCMIWHNNDSWVF
nr:immunoglobulin light chain junction region [Macaca mulatta]MOX69346.1 immunoglobulin light chain junction region [Macaca mulatta]MOX69737.1 immunoglobulin light chain junction region [Macaca mulatta]MOX70249.1 immunoglobulin light chain junction region [Macaca mulatta]MOX72738.1 immunoglobulin light chain junction region [Macaca mulatta]